MNEDGKSHFEIVEPDNDTSVEPSKTKVDEHLEWRHKDANVMRFVPIIKELLDHHTDSVLADVSFSPEGLGLSKDVAMSRVRDALQAFVERKQHHPAIDCYKLAQIRPLYKVGWDATSRRVHVYDRHFGRKDAIPETGSITDFIEKTLQVDEPAFEDNLVRLAGLFSTKCLKGIVIINGILDEFLKQKIIDEFPNLLLEQKAPNKHIML